MVCSLGGDIFWPDGVIPTEILPLLPLPFFTPRPCRAELVPGAGAVEFLSMSWSWQSGVSASYIDFLKVLMKLLLVVIRLGARSVRNIETNLFALYLTIILLTIF